MRRINLWLLSVLFFVAASCQSDEAMGVSWVSPANPVLVKKMTTSSYDVNGQLVSTSVNEFEYEGINLVSYTSGNSKKVFYYSGTRITKRQDFQGGELQKSFRYKYASGKLVSVEEERSGADIEVFNYGYSGDQLIGMEHTYRNHSGTFQNMNVYSYSYQYSNLNKTQEDYMSDPTHMTTNFTSYDSSNNPFRDANAYLRISVFKDTSVNNFLTSDYISFVNTVRSIVYGSDGFPLQIDAQISNSTSGVSHTVTTYEYL